MSDFKVQNVWVEGFTTLGLTAGSAQYKIQNKGSGTLVIQYVGSAPDANDTDGIHLYPEESFILPLTVTSFYIRAYSYSCNVAVTESSNFEDSSVIPSDLLTSPYAETRRLAVDSQQTSFEENRQFRFFEDCSIQQWNGGFDNRVASGNVLVYWFTAPNALNIQSRLLNGWAGGRKYLVFPVDGNETITGGTFSDVSNLISVMNNSLADINPTHPTSGVTIQKRIATSFVSTTPPRTGIPYKSDSNQNRNTSSYSPQGDRAGVGAGSEFYLVLFDIASGAVSSEFMIEIAWEEVIDLPQVV